MVRELVSKAIADMHSNRLVTLLQRSPIPFSSTTFENLSSAVKLAYGITMPAELWRWLLPMAFKLIPAERMRSGKPRSNTSPARLGSTACGATAASTLSPILSLWGLANGPSETAHRYRSGSAGTFSPRLGSPSEMRIIQLPTPPQVACQKIARSTEGFRRFGKRITRQPLSSFTKLS